MISNSLVSIPAPLWVALVVQDTQMSPGKAPEARLMDSVDWEMVEVCEEYL